MDNKSLSDISAKSFIPDNLSFYFFKSSTSVHRKYNVRMPVKNQTPRALVVYLQCSIIIPVIFPGKLLLPQWQYPRATPVRPLSVNLLRAQQTESLAAHYLHAVCLFVCICQTTADWGLSRWNATPCSRAQEGEWLPLGTVLPPRLFRLRGNRISLRPLRVTVRLTIFKTTIEIFVI